MGISPPSISTAKRLTNSTTGGRPKIGEAGVGGDVVNYEARDDGALIVTGWVSHKADEVVGAASVVAD